MARSKSDDEVAVGKVADMLIQAGCEIESRAGTDGFSDFTVLMFSAYHGHVGVVRHLIDARCEINAQSSVGLVLEGFSLRKLQLLQYCFLQSLHKKPLQSWCFKYVFSHRNRSLQYIALSWEL